MKFPNSHIQRNKVNEQNFQLNRLVRGMVHSISNDGYVWSIDDFSRQSYGNQRRRKDAWDVG